MSVVAWSALDVVHRAVLAVVVGAYCEDPERGVIDYPGKELVLARLELDVALTVGNLEVVWMVFGHFGGCFLMIH
jgi:hypothetical protein